MAIASGFRDIWLAAYVVHNLDPRVANIFPAGESLHVYAYGHRILDPRLLYSRHQPSALVLTVPLVYCNRYRQESSSRFPISFVSVLRFGSFLVLGGLSGRASRGVLSCLSVRWGGLSGRASGGPSCPSVGSSPIIIYLHICCACVALYGLTVCEH